MPVSKTDNSECEVYLNVALSAESPSESYEAALNLVRKLEKMGILDDEFTERALKR